MIWLKVLTRWEVSGSHGCAAPEACTSSGTSVRRALAETLARSATRQGCNGQATLGERGHDVVAVDLPCESESPGLCDNVDRAGRAIVPPF